MVHEIPDSVDDDVARALAEDLGPGDATAALIPAGTPATAHVVCRDNAVLCGTAWFDATFRQVDPRIEVIWQLRDGDRVEAGQIVCRLAGPAPALLSGERTALNFLQTLSGTATIAHRYAAAVAATHCRVLDTRKTIPGLRAAQKYAVRCGGCENHRMGLFDAILIKENHIMAAGGIRQAIAAARHASPGLLVEVEVESPAQLPEALAARPDRIMLDNFSREALAQAVSDVAARRKAGRPALEASGNVDLASIAGIAATGVDFISVGALTKHVRAIDLSMRFAMGI